LRDPKFAVIGDRLFIYLLYNIIWTAAPHQTLYTVTNDGISWTEIQPLDPDGWLFWRPKTMNDTVWYCPAYEKGMERTAVFRSLDGIQWAFVSDIVAGLSVNETEIEFTKDGQMTAVARLRGTKGDFGDNRAGTIVGYAEHPFTDWRLHRNSITRLDGPLLFSIEERLFAAGRFQPERDNWLFQQGTIMSRKRTSLFEVVNGRLVYLSDLPSSGDTSYPGVVRYKGKIVIGYYSSDIRFDPPWILGMFSKSGIQVLELPVSNLLTLANAKAGSADPTYKNPLFNYILFAGLVAGGAALSIVLLRKLKFRRGKIK